MQDLNYQLKILCRHSREGSYSTRVGRERQLTAIANQLHQLGYRRMGARSLKPKHVEALVQAWLQQGLNPGTIKNRMSCLRWWAEKVNKQNVIARGNDHYGIPDRKLIGEASKARELTAAKLELIKDPYVRMSLRLQAAFGLRREEALKIQPRWSDQGVYLQLKSSWTKGGRARSVPILTDCQRAVLADAKRLAGSGSLIPRDRQYIQQLRIYERQAANAGLSKMHGLRYAYAQQRYRDLTGWACPHAGGPGRNVLSSAERDKDEQARLTISQELGHTRLQIVAVYCGI